MRKIFLIAGTLAMLAAIIYRRDTDASYAKFLQMAAVADETTIPSDVQKKIDEEALANNNTSDVLGTQELRVPILMYHYVEYVQDKGDKTRISLNTTPWTLENEIKTLADAGYTFMTNAELIDVMNGKAELPPKPILLTFDDGYRDFYTYAYPILKKYHAKATQYVISGFLGYKNHLLVSQLQEIANEGLVEIGAHTTHHVWLKGQRTSKVLSEIFQNKADLSKLINKPVVSFAYPFGAFDQQSLETVRNAGFGSAVSTIPGIDQKRQNRFFLYRLRPGGRTGDALLAWLEHQK